MPFTARQILEHKVLRAISHHTDMQIIKVVGEDLDSPEPYITMTTRGYDGKDQQFIVTVEEVGAEPAVEEDDEEEVEEAPAVDEPKDTVEEADARGEKVDG